MNVCIFRIPEGNFWKSHRSKCRHCGAPISSLLNIPVLSYLMLRGRTSCCQSKLSIQYPIVEILTGLFVVLAYWKFPFVSFGGGQWEIHYADFLRFAHAFVFISILVVCSFIDLRLMIIPDVISIPMVLISPFVVWFHPDLTLFDSTIGILAGGLSLYSIAWLYWLLRREVGMGMGDVKLLAGIGGWLGYQSIIPTILYGSVLGTFTGLCVMIFTRRLSMQSAIPFGPFLGIGAIIHLLFGSIIQQLYAY